MIYPIIIVRDRYHGAYSGGEWIAWNEYKAPEGSQGDDAECMTFWDDYNGNIKDYPLSVGRGDNPQEAYLDLLQTIYFRNEKGVATRR